MRAEPEPVVEIDERIAQIIETWSRPALARLYMILRDGLGCRHWPLDALVRDLQP